MLRESERCFQSKSQPKSNWKCAIRGVSIKCDMVEERQAVWVVCRNRRARQIRREKKRERQRSLLAKGNQCGEMAKEKYLGKSLTIAKEKLQLNVRYTTPKGSTIKT